MNGEKRELRCLFANVPVIAALIQKPESSVGAVFPERMGQFPARPRQDIKCLHGPVNASAAVTLSGMIIQ